MAKCVPYPPPPPPPHPALPPPPPPQYRMSVMAGDEAIDWLCIDCGRWLSSKDKSKREHHFLAEVVKDASSFHDRSCQAQPDSVNQCSVGGECGASTLEHFPRSLGTLPKKSGNNAAELQNIAQEGVEVVKDASSIHASSFQAQPDSVSQCSVGGECGQAQPDSVSQCSVGGECGISKLEYRRWLNVLQSTRSHWC